MAFYIAKHPVSGVSGTGCFLVGSTVILVRFILLPAGQRTRIMCKKN